MSIESQMKTRLLTINVSIPSSDGRSPDLVQFRQRQFN